MSLKNNQRTKRKKKDQKSGKYEPQKKIKIDHESVRIQMPLPFYFTLQNKIVCSLSKMPKSMMVKYINVD